MALREALSVLNPKVDIHLGAAKGISKRSWNIIEKSEILINPPLDVELLIILDTSTLEQISPLDSDINKAKKIAVMDHRTPHHLLPKLFTNS